MKARLVSDGTVAGTHIVVGEERLEGVTHVAWRIDVNTGLATLELTIRRVPVAASASTITVREFE